MFFTLHKTSLKSKMVADTRVVVIVGAWDGAGSIPGASGVRWSGAKAWAWAGTGTGAGTGPGTASGLSDQESQSPAPGAPRLADSPGLGAPRPIYKVSDPVGRGLGCGEEEEEPVTYLNEEEEAPKKS